MSNSILVLGAGAYQVPLIERIQDREYQALVASIPGDYLGIEKCDRFFPINTTDVNDICSLAMKERISAIVTAGTDVALPSLAAVCDSLNLSGPTREMVASASNKLRMKECLMEGNARTSPFRMVRTIDGAHRAVSELGLPAVFKCVDKSGSRGISIVKKECEVQEALKNALGVSDCDYIVVEKFVFGHEVGVDGYVNKHANVVFSQVHDKIVWNNGLTDVPIGHKVNSAFIEWCEEFTDIDEVVKTAIHAIGAKCAFFNMDVMVDPDGRAWIIEVGLRTGATCIPEVIGVYNGFDYYDAVLDAALGIEPTFRYLPAVKAAEGRLLFSPTPAVLSSLPGSHRENIQISIDTPVNSNWPAFRTGNQRRGQLVGFGDDATLLSLQMEEIVSDFITHNLCYSNDSR